MWWHSPYDTLDKGDRDHLLRDMRMEALAICRSVNAGVLPFDFSEVAGMYEETVVKIEERASGAFDLSPTLDRIGELKSKSERMNDVIAGLDEFKASEVNELLSRVSKILTSTYYTHAGAFDQDPAYGIPHLPALQDAAKLAGLDPASDEVGFLRTRLIRETNRVNKAIDTATELISEAIRISS